MLAQIAVNDHLIVDQLYVKAAWLNAKLDRDLYSAA